MTLTYWDIEIEILGERERDRETESRREKKYIFKSETF